MYSRWQLWSDRVDGQIKSDITVVLHTKVPGQATEDSVALAKKLSRAEKRREDIGKGGIEGLDIGYSKLKDHVEKSIFLLGEDEVSRCSVCSEVIGPPTLMALVCPQEGCRTVSHMKCLAAVFLRAQHQSKSVLPVSGSCPGCRAELQWVDLIMEMSLRANGEREIKQLMKKPKQQRTKLPRAINNVSSQIEGGSLEEDNHEALNELAENAQLVGVAADDALLDDWDYQGDDDDAMSMTSAASDCSDRIGTVSSIQAPSAAPSLGVVIEDSEEDEAGIPA